MSDVKPDYAAIIKSRKPVPILDLGDLRRRSAEATEATIVRQPTGEPIAGRPTQNEGPGRTEPGATTTEIEIEATVKLASGVVRVPLRFSVSQEVQRRLRIQAAVENRSVPELMRKIIAAYLRANGRAL